MPKIISIFILLIVISSCFRPNIIYLNKDWKKCEKKEANYYRTIKQTGEVYLVKDFYLNRNPQMVAECSTIEPTLLYNGRVTHYDENGLVISSGNYSGGKKYGLWIRINNKTKDTTLVDYYLNGDFNYHIKNTNVSKREDFDPQYNGGSIAISQFISNNLKYPAKAKVQRVGGKLDVHFIIDTFGNATNIKVLKGISKEIDEEGVRLIKLLNRWIPALKNEKKISVAYSIPIFFFPDKEYEAEFKIQEAKKNIYKAFFDLDRKIVDSVLASFYTLYFGTDTTRKSGTNETYLLTGILLSQENYIINKNNEREETVTYFFDNGQVRSVHHIKEGKKNGELIAYFADGNVNRKELYQFDTIVERHYFTKAGKDTLGSSSDERLSSFPGGEKALKYFIKRHTIYPKIAIKKRIEGEVFVNYLVDKYGNVKNVKVNQSVDPNLDKEAVRVIESLPKWRPGYMRDQALSSYHLTSVVFSLK